MNDERYLSLTQLAKIVGGTSHTVGKTLTGVGLRTNGTPSQMAFSLGLVKQAPTGRGVGYFYLWNEAKTLPYLTGEMNP